MKTIYQLVNDDLITAKQGFTICLVEQGWPSDEARRIAATVESMRRTEVLETNNVTDIARRPRKVSKNTAKAGKRTNWTRWTDQERDELTKMWKEGTSIKEIAANLNRTHGQITAALTRYGLYKEHSRRQAANT